MVRLRALAAVLAIAAPAAALERPGLCPTGTIERLDPRVDALIAPGAELETIAEGFRWVEGPLWRPEERDLLFSDIPANAIFRWRAGRGTTRFLHPSGYSGTAPFTGREPGSNGLALDPEGRLVVCEHGDRRIVRYEPDGRKTVLADRFEGKRLNSPNDVVATGDGTLYFTDPPFGLPGTFDDPARELDFTGVYRRRPDGRLELLTTELSGANGIAVSPSGRTLYVSNARPERPVWMAYDFDADGRLGPGRVLHDATAWTKVAPGFPDGLTVDRKGNLFAAGPGGVHVFTAAGERLGTICIERPTSNAAIGEGDATLFITADTAVYRLRLDGGSLP